MQELRILTPGGLTLKFWSRKHKWIHTSLKCHHILWKCTIVGLLFPPTQFLLAAFQDSIVLFLHLPLVLGPLLPLKTPQFQALPTSTGPASPDKCSSPDPTNGQHHPWCKINTIKTNIWLLSGLTLFLQSSQQRTLQLGRASKVMTLQSFSIVSLLLASFANGWPHPIRMRVSWAFEPGKGQPGCPAPGISWLGS